MEFALTASIQCHLSLQKSLQQHNLVHHSCVHEHVLHPSTLWTITHHLFCPLYLPILLQYLACDFVTL